MSASQFEKRYEIITDGPKAIEWDDYVTSSTHSYQELLNAQGSEADFQEFFEKNPAFLPGAYGFFGESGHPPFMNALITQPQLRGLATKVPDFLWIATDSSTIYPVFIELEAPTKKWFVRSGYPSSDFSQAQTQLLDWKNWFNDGNNQELFFKYYDIDTSHRKNKAFQPFYVLIYGSRDEFQSNPRLNEKRSYLARNNEVHMTFERVTPNPKAKNVITCTVKSGEYFAKEIPVTFTLEPTFAEELSKIKGLEQAIRKSEISQERKEFLCSRLDYWIKYARSPKRLEILGAGDCE